VDTLKELFEGNRALFEGLAAEPRWDWSRRHPVVRISFADGVLRGRIELERRIRDQLRLAREDLGLPELRPGPERTCRANFAELIRRPTAQPASRWRCWWTNTTNPSWTTWMTPAIAAEMRDGLRSLYSVLKGSDAHLKFVFLTGVSKFSKVSLFSGLNNLQDLTLDPQFSALCGYTDADIDSVFAPELPGWTASRSAAGTTATTGAGRAVYNPFDVLLLFRNRQFRPYWFETGTPTFLTRLLAERQFFTPDLQRLQSDAALLSSFDVDHIEPEALLFQTGYLTCTAARRRARTTSRCTPWATRTARWSGLNEALLPEYGVPARLVQTRVELGELLQRSDWAACRPMLQALYASIPHDWYRRSPLAGFEGHYASVFYSHFAALGLDLRVEDATSHGRIDLTLLHAGQVFLFEFKVVEQQATGEALRQLQARGYADKYRARGEPIHLIGIEFSRAQRNVVGFEVETIATRTSS
jgi:hypothetical protein